MRKSIAHCYFIALKFVKRIQIGCTAYTSREVIQDLHQYCPTSQTMYSTNVNHNHISTIMYTVYIVHVLCLTHTIFDMDASLNKRINQDHQ